MMEKAINAANHSWFRPAPISFCSTRIGSIPTETKEARFTTARSGDPAAYRRWTGLMAPLIEVFGHLDARSFLETDRAAVPQGD
jgi:hypothetical protein